MTVEDGAETLHEWTNGIHQGDTLDTLDELPTESVHAVVADPPYGLAFMGRDWDDFDPKEYQEWSERWARASKRVLKPGGYLLAFSGNRTHHRLFTGVEDAGFEIRDTLTWHYGNGFPKNTDTHLKPATEFIVLSRKPCGGPAKECHAEHGTGYLNVEGCRLEPGRGDDREGEPTGESRYTEDGATNMAAKPGPRGGCSEGRYPANLLLDADAADRMDDEVGELSSGVITDSHNIESETAKNCYGDYGERTASDFKTIGDSGGPSRFFYTSKASTAERTMDGKIDNDHPTVKPLDLMEWLVRLVTSEGQVVLDPFVGSGTTCLAAKNGNRQFIGIEQQSKWSDIARARCGLTPEDPSVVRSDDGQTGIEAYGTEANHD